MKTALIIGGSRGIGKETVKLFVKKGYKVAFTYHTSKKEAEELCQSLSEYPVFAFPVDVSNEAEVLSMISSVQDRLGEIDVLINNAGIAQQKLFTDITSEDWNSMFSVHVDGVYYAIRATLPDMIKRKKGTIINVSSMWGQVGASCEVHYSAAKAAVIGLTKALAKEVGPSGIRVNCVAPGVIQTDMNQDLENETMQELEECTPLGRIGTAEEVAKTIFFLASDEASFITGQILGVNGGMII